MKRHFFLLPLALAALLVACDTPEAPPDTIYYAVTYFGNGSDSGAAPVDNNKYPEGSSATVLDKETLAKTGHIFLHWDISPWGDGVSYNPNERIIINSDRSLYAIWGSFYTVTFNTSGGSEIQPVSELLPGSKITKPSDPIKSGFTFDAWYKNAGLTEVWDFDNDVVSGNITLYAKWLDVAPGEVEITNCSYNATNNSIDIYYTIPSDTDLDYLIVYVNGEVYYYSIPKTYVGIYLYNVQNGSLVTIKTVDGSGNISSGVNYTIDIPGYTPITSIIEIITSANVILKYSDRIDPTSISCSLKAYMNNEYVTINALPAGWTLSYITSTQQVDIPYDGPIVIDRSWGWIEFKLYKDGNLFDRERVPILSDY